MIELEANTAHILKAPNQMPSNKSKELKVQLQELLNQDFILSSVTPWSVLVLFVKKRMAVCTIVSIISN